MKQLIAGLLLGLFVTLGAVQADTSLTAFAFKSEAEEQHFKSLISDLRCLVCQNQTLLDSDAELAHDLRSEVFDLMREGKNDKEVIAFLVARYGDFVLYNPPFKPSTYLLWFGPFVLLAIAALVLFRALRRRAKITDPEFTEEQRRQLDGILGNDADTDQRP